jgi:hypothetical protein
MRAQLDEGRIWLGDHSFSWVTLEELLGCDLDAPVTLRGMVSPGDAQRYRETGQPPGTRAGWVRNPSWVRLEWQEPLRRVAWLVPQLIEAVEGLGAPQHVRLVFGFDS